MDVDPPETIQSFRFWTSDLYCGLELTYVDGNSTMVALAVDSLVDFDHDLTNSILRCATTAPAHERFHWEPRSITSKGLHRQLQDVEGLLVTAVELREIADGPRILMRFWHGTHDFTDALILASEAQKLVAKVREIRAAVVATVEEDR